MARPGYKRIAGRWYRKEPKKMTQNESSPSRRRIPWATLTIRMEHYAMARELAEFHRCAIGAVVMALIQDEFIRQLAVTDPEKARQIEEEYGPQYKYGNR